MLLLLGMYSNYTNFGEQTILVFLNKHLSLNNYKTCFFFNFKSPYQLHVGNTQEEKTFKISAAKTCW